MKKSRINDTVYTDFVALVLWIVDNATHSMLVEAEYPNNSYKKPSLQVWENKIGHFIGLLSYKVFTYFLDVINLN